MTDKTNKIDIKNHICHFIDDIINIENLDANKVKTEDSYLPHWKRDGQSH